MSLATPKSIAPRPNIGNYANELAALDAVVARLVTELDPQAIWLFGSRALHPSPLRGGWPFALAKGRERVASPSPDSVARPPSGQPTAVHLPHKVEG